MKDGLRFVDPKLRVDFLEAQNSWVPGSLTRIYSNFPNVSSNLLRTVPRDIAAQIFMGGAHLYGFTDEDFEKADAAVAARGNLTAMPVGD